MCKNYELTNKCKFGDEVSKNYFKRVLIIISPYIVFFRPLEKLNDDEKHELINFLTTLAQSDNDFDAREANFI
jgi:hypothetical protein